VKVVHVEAGRHLYGGALQVLYLLRGLRQESGRNVLVCPADSAIAEAARDVADAVYAVPMGGELDVAFVARLLRVLRRERPDLVHLHSRRGADPWGAVAARLASVPVVLSRRVDNPESRWQVRWKYRLYDHVITISEAIRNVLLAEGVPPEQVTCVHSAVDTELYRPGCDREWFLRELRLEPADRVVGMVAQFIERKGHLVLLEAVPHVVAGIPGARFVLFGRGPLLVKMEAEVASRGLLGAVRFGGFREDLHRVLPCLDVLVHPALMEGLGVSLLQAAACGVPIVGAGVGGIPEVVRHGETGYLTDPGDAGATGDFLARLLEDPARRRAFGEAGRHDVEQRFSIPSMVAGNRAVYTQLLERRRDG
jgi:glycosyltransferase involved in cell wall biosynthesis